MADDGDNKELAHPHTVISGEPTSVFLFLKKFLESFFFLLCGIIKWPHSG